MAVGTTRLAVVPTDPAGALKEDEEQAVSSNAETAVKRTAVLTGDTRTHLLPVVLRAVVLLVVVACGKSTRSGGTGDGAAR